MIGQMGYQKTHTSKSRLWYIFFDFSNDLFYLGNYFKPPSKVPCSHCTMDIFHKIWVFYDIGQHLRNGLFQVVLLINVLIRQNSTHIGHVCQVVLLINVLIRQNSTHIGHICQVVLLINVLIRQNSTHIGHICQLCFLGLNLPLFIPISNNVVERFHFSFQFIFFQITDVFIVETFHFSFLKRSIINKSIICILLDLMCISVSQYSISQYHFSIHSSYDSYPISQFLSFLSYFLSYRQSTEQLLKIMTTPEETSYQEFLSRHSYPNNFRPIPAPTEQDVSRHIHMLNDYL